MNQFSVCIDGHRLVVIFLSHLKKKKTSETSVYEAICIVAFPRLWDSAVENLLKIFSKNRYTMIMQWDKLQQVNMFTKRYWFDYFEVTFFMILSLFTTIQKND